VGGDDPGPGWERNRHLAARPPGRCLVRAAYNRPAEAGVTSSRSSSRSGPAVGRSENWLLVNRCSWPASTASDTDARSTAVGRQSSSPVISVVLMAAGYDRTVRETLRHMRRSSSPERSTRAVWPASFLSS
jgi:hypothetical protein